MTKYKCTYGFTEKIIEASDEDEARDEFAYNFIENEDEINDFLLQDIKFCTKVEECE
jgi:hypothetical protein